mmetsp:Transcript_33357/g.70172  ORF Transcript_33357/g.70172 Transcript_33357/m.70172 type:complete len:83 (+) Transcript_33357:252-500(+)
MRCGLCLFVCGGGAMDASLFVRDDAMRYDVGCGYLSAAALWTRGYWLVGMRDAVDAWIFVCSEEALALASAMERGDGNRRRR